LRRLEQRFDVGADGIELLALVHEVAVGLAQLVLDSGLERRQRELLELAMCIDQNLRSRRLERNSPLRAEDRVADMDAPTDCVSLA
jgi:hypothetical protein